MSYTQSSETAEPVRTTGRHRATRPGYKRSMHAGALIKRETGRPLFADPRSAPKHSASSTFPGIAGDLTGGE